MTLAETVKDLLPTGIMLGGVAGAFATFRKLKPESDQIIVSSAKDVVVIQKGLVDNLREQMAEQRQQMADLENRFDARLGNAEQARWAAETALAECHRAREALLEDYEQEKARNAELEERIVACEAEIAALREQTGHTLKSRTRSTDPKEIP